MSSPPTHIRTARLLLRPIVADDRDAFIDLLTASKDHFAPWWPLPLPGDTPTIIFERQLERQAIDHATGLGFRRGAFLRDGPSSGALVGLVNLGQIFRGPFLSCFIGWSIDVRHIGHGLAPEAVNGMLDAAFSPEPLGLALHRVQANIMPRNAASLRVASKCGFRHEGLAKAYLQIAGAWEDHEMFAKLVSEHTITSELIAGE
jgi:ribosomal-protein-alanine N-acetyltransferase